MASYNKITLIGNVGNDPQMRIVGDNRKVTDLSIAINEKGRNGQPDKTEWYKVALWDNKAEVAATYIKRGNPVYIEGRLSVRTYIDKDGRERYSLEVVATDMQLLGSREPGDGSAMNQTPMSNPVQRQAPPMAAAPVPTAAPAAPINLIKTEEEDDLPF